MLQQAELNFTERKDGLMDTFTTKKGYPETNIARGTAQRCGYSPITWPPLHSRGPPLP